MEQGCLFAITGQVKGKESDQTVELGLRIELFFAI